MFNIFEFLKQLKFLIYFSDLLKIIALYFRTYLYKYYHILLSLSVKFFFITARSFKITLNYNQIVKK